jgi:hypothetical protein
MKRSNNSVLQHPVALSSSDFCYTFAIYMHLWLMLTLFPLHCNSQYMFQRNWPYSTSYVLKGTAILLFCSNCCGLFFILVTCYSYAHV